MSKSVRIIPPRIQVKNPELEEQPKLKVAAYCRVSTDSDEQASSYEVQIEHYTNFIQKNPEWSLAGIYADDGITGTNTKKRDEFNRMIKDCLEGKIDMIITKSISRFARNTLDCLKYIRELKDRNIPVYFEKENINTMDSKGEVMLTIMASLAQQESQSLSQNVKLGIQYRYQQGEIQVNHNRFMGYTKDKDKRLVIVPEEAEIVKRIYREYLDGASLNKIGKGLQAEGILTAAKKEIWRPETVRKILKNEKYIGDALLQKTYTVDFLTKKRVVNDGLVPQYYVENSHEAIISREIFRQVQEELARRSSLPARKNGAKRQYSSRYSLSGVVYCAHCGEIYRRVHWNNRGCKSIVWRCLNRLEGKDCGGRTLNEEVLHKGIVRAVNEVLGESYYREALEQNIHKVLKKSEISQVDKDLAELQEELMGRVISKQDYKILTKQIERLKEQREQIQADRLNNQNLMKKLVEIRSFLDDQTGELEEYDDQLVRNLVERVTVFDDHIEVKFRTGAEIKILSN